MMDLGPEPIRTGGPSDPCLVLITVRYPCGRVYNIVASATQGSGSGAPPQWYVTGVVGGCWWEQILRRVLRPALGEPTTLDVELLAGCTFDREMAMLMRPGPALG